jgi:hypothetical protein
MSRTVPALTLQNPGNLVTAALWNAGPKAIGDFYLAPPLFRCRQSTSQSTTSGSYFAMHLDATAEVDTEGGHSSVTNNSRYTAQVAGWYWVSGFVAWANTTGAQADMFCAIALNGSIVLGTGQVYQRQPNDFDSLCASGLIHMNVGDYVEVWGRQDSGSTISTWATNVDLNPVLTAMWVHN